MGPGFGVPPHVLHSGRIPGVEPFPEPPIIRRILRAGDPDAVEPHGPRLVLQPLGEVVHSENE